MNKFTMLWKPALAIFLSILLLACSKLTQDNFNKIKPGMTLQEVIVILGNPTSTENLTIGGMSGTSAIWKNKDTEIDIQFLNDRVLVKSFSNTLDDSTPGESSKKKV